MEQIKNVILGLITGSAAWHLGCIDCFVIGILFWYLAHQIKSMNQK